MVDTMYVDGRAVSSEGREVLTVRNPATGRVVGTAPAATAGDVAAAVAAARRAFDDGPWPRMSPAERAAPFRRLAEEIRRHRAELVELVIAEGGVPRRIADHVHVQPCIDYLHDLADRVLPALSFQTPLAPHTTPAVGGARTTQGVVLREPCGVASLITPFNGPLPMTVQKLGSALSAGCTAVVKPSPYTPLQVLRLAELIDAAGFPPGVVNVVTGDVEASVEMTTNPGVDVVSFTGSAAVGRLIQAQAAPTLKRVVLELGGKSANIVFADADLDRVAAEVVGNTVAYAGQICLLLTRTLVEESVYDVLRDKVLALLPGVTIGDPDDPDTMMGPLIGAAERDRVEHMVAQARAEGATVAYGGGRPAGLDAGHYLQPTLLTDVEAGMTIARTEVFGPVNTMIRFTDEDDAVRLANDTEYGLNASVFSRDFRRAHAVARRLRCGMVTVNTSWGSHPDAPFGGYKQSGIGREGGAYGIAEYLEEKFVSWPVGGG